MLFLDQAGSGLVIIQTCGLDGHGWPGGENQAHYAGISLLRYLQTSFSVLYVEDVY